MHARSLAVLEQGASLRLDGERLRVESGGELIRFVRLSELSEVLLFGHVQLTTAAALACLARGIDVLFLTRRGRWRGRLAGRPGRQVETRIAQLTRLSAPSEALRLARCLVAGKLSNQRNLLLRAQRERHSNRLARQIAQLRLLVEGLDSADSLDGVRGLEGRGAAVYFTGLASCVRNPELRMNGRTRRPPRDAPNAILSFGYTMLAALVESLVLRAGLDPYIGALHAPGRGNPAAVLDLMEELRPLAVDALMLRLLNRRELTREDFENPALEDEPELWDDDGTEGAGSPPAAVWLAESGRRIFFRSWGRRLAETRFYPPRGYALSLEEIAREQVFHFARVLRGEDPIYVPFVPR